MKLLVYNKFWQRVNQKLTVELSVKLNIALHSVLCKRTVTNKINLRSVLGVDILQQKQVPLVQNLQTLRTLSEHKPCIWKCILLEK